MAARSDFCDHRFPSSMLWCQHTPAATSLAVLLSAGRPIFVTLWVMRDSITSPPCMEHVGSQQACAVAGLTSSCRRSRCRNGDTPSSWPPSNAPSLANGITRTFKLPRELRLGSMHLRTIKYSGFNLVVDTASRAQKRPWLSQLPYVRPRRWHPRRPSEARLQPSGVADDEAAAHGLVLVRAALTRTRARGKDVEQFLRRVGVKEIGERDYLLAILSSQYNGNRPGPGGERHLQHMRRFLRYFSETRDATLFEDATIFRSQDAEGFLKASSVYLSSPFSQSALSRIYGGRVKGRTRRPLWEGYAKLKRNDLIAFAAATGVESHLQIEKTRVGYNHPKWASLTEGFGGTRITASRVSSDYQIEQLSGLVGLRDVEVARMVWKAVADQGVHCMYAHWAPNQTYQPNRELSSLALILQQTEWIPAKDGNFKLPRSITSPELMSGFPTSGQ